MVFVYGANGDFVGATVSDSSGAYSYDDLAIDVTHRVDVDTDGDFQCYGVYGQCNTNRCDVATVSRTPSFK